MADDESGAAVGCGPVCVPARRTRLQLLSCDMWLSEGVGEEVLVPSGMLNHGGQHVAGASRGSCVQRGRAPLLSATVQ